MQSTLNSPLAIPLAAAPALVAIGELALWLSTDGEIEELSGSEAASRAELTPPLLCHGLSVATRLNLNGISGFDVLELFAFVRPATFCLPTPGGLAKALNLKIPSNESAEAVVLQQATALLLKELQDLPTENKKHLFDLTTTMAKGGWRWTSPIFAALNLSLETSRPNTGLDIWTRLPEWTEFAPIPAPFDTSITVEDTRERLRQLLGSKAEARPTQIEFSVIATQAFRPRGLEGEPNLVLAEAGTGTGKTLGYVAPASLWAEQSGGTVWLSTYTKNLQRQIDQELDSLFPDPMEKATKVVLRKGRENYLCLFNFEEATQGGAFRPQDAVALGLMARWAEATRDGDMVGGDFPAWLIGLVGAGRTIGLTDRRGECIYSACSHYKRCFIERSIRKSRRAEIVIANHALVMFQAARAADQSELPLRYVFDEGHHLFDAADSAFSITLSGQEAAELRRWLRGEDRRRRRMRGLERRIGDIADNDPKTAKALNDILSAALALPADGWLNRINQNFPEGPTEDFLEKVRTHVLARARSTETAQTLEAATTEPTESLLEKASILTEALKNLAHPLRALAKALLNQLDDVANKLETSTRTRIEATVRGLDWRIRLIEAWHTMLKDLLGTTPMNLVDWFSLEKTDNRTIDIGFHRHWIDPTEPFAQVVLRPAHGALLTSATLRDHDTDRDGEHWRSAEVRTGTHHFAQPAARLSVQSPFDYAKNTCVFIVTDVRRDNVSQVAAAYRELFLAAGGGSLGLFTAISRLRAVQKRLIEPLARAGLPLFAQHVDPLDISSLVDIFRAEVKSCLLGTDAVRDGVDVPGAALRLIVFDRVPWPRPDILHRARRQVLGGSTYDDMITRLRIKQAFGRLVRRTDDKGVFVMLDAMLPSRLLGAFPADIEVRRIGLAEAVRETGKFLAGYR